MCLVWLMIQEYVYCKVDVVIHTCNFTTREVEAGRLPQVKDHPGL